MAALIPCKIFFSLRKFPEIQRHTQEPPTFICHHHCPSVLVPSAAAHTQRHLFSEQCNALLPGGHYTGSLWKWELDTVLSPGQCFVLLHTFSCPFLLIILMAFTFPFHSSPKTIPVPCEGLPYPITDHGNLLILCIQFWDHYRCNADWGLPRHQTKHILWLSANLPLSSTVILT